jgi:glycolate oxidase iron-sulfur subunit
MYELINQMEDEIVKCVRCGVCRIHCPTFLATNAESAVSRGKIYLVDAVLKGELELTDEFARDMYRCVNCRTVTVNCPTSVQVHNIILQARAQLVKSRGLSDLRDIIFDTSTNSERPVDKRLAFFQEEISRNLPSDNPWQSLLPLTDKKREFSSLLKELENPPFIKGGKGGFVDNPKMKVGYFVGSAIDMMYPEIGRAVVNVLKALDFEVIVPPDQKCSGYSFRTLGDIDTAAYLARANIEAFAEADVDAIVTADSSCALEMKQGYVEVLGEKVTEEFNGKVYDISEFLTSGKVGALNLTPLRQVSKKVTYHEACALGKGLKMSDPPKEILDAIPGLEFVEMDGAELCCGSGCGVFAMGRNYDLSMKIAERKFDNIMATEADVVVTSCPHCQLQLSEMLASKGVEKEFLHPVQILEMALRGATGDG